jgi:hypothetical protein
MVKAEIERRAAMATVRKLAESKAGAEAADTDTPWTMSIPAAGRKYFGLGKFASYQASGPIGEDALIPYVEVGRLKRALPRLIEKRLAGKDSN